MDKKQFQEFIDEIVPSSLFHVSKTDKDENGISCEDIILVDLLSKNPGALKHKSLTWFVNTFINNNSY